ncbi:hypothetical protein WR25_18725 isoform B [Diploscapter pachys]|uniref:Uncharacterized protein n=1 Tax=Diploscapter pachys TaxID=2018661 RepID=A0A2A2KFI8_9BILA|nr:hypothetical protein WR25_18725 isoform A [Diploscapter pachys]PAV72745.1 hypothetical protein WR25_18725 isoform B [Diploscapter pachys]
MYRQKRDSDRNSDDEERSSRSRSSSSSSTGSTSSTARSRSRSSRRSLERIDPDSINSYSSLSSLSSSPSTSFTSPAYLSTAPTASTPSPSSLSASQPLSRGSNSNASVRSPFCSDFCKPRLNRDNISSLTTSRGSMPFGLRPSGNAPPLKELLVGDPVLEDLPVKVMTYRFAEVTINPQLVLFVTEFLYFGEGWRSKTEQFDVAARMMESHLDVPDVPRNINEAKLHKGQFYMEQISGKYIMYGRCMTTVKMTDNNEEGFEVADTRSIVPIPGCNERNLPCDVYLQPAVRGTLRCNHELAINCETFAIKLNGEPTGEFEMRDRISDAEALELANQVRQPIAFKENVEFVDQMLFIDTSDVVHLPADQRHQLVKSSTDDKTLVMKQVTLIIRGDEEGLIVEELRHYYDRVPGMNLGPDELYCVIKRQEIADMNQFLGSSTEDPSTRRADDNQQNQLATPGLHSFGGFKDGTRRASTPLSDSSLQTSTPCKQSRQSPSGELREPSQPLQTSTSLKNVPASIRSAYLHPPMKQMDEANPRLEGKQAMPRTPNKGADVKNDGILESLQTSTPLKEKNAGPRSEYLHTPLEQAAGLNTLQSRKLQPEASHLTVKPVKKSMSQKGSTETTTSSKNSKASPHRPDDDDAIEVDFNPLDDPILPPNSFQTQTRSQSPNLTTLPSTYQEQVCASFFAF